MNSSPEEVEEVENLVHKMMPSINEYWDLRSDEELSEEDIEITTQREFQDLQGLDSEKHILPEDTFFGTYTEDAQSFLYVAVDNVNHFGREVSPSEMGEELSHIAHQRAGNATSQYLRVSMNSGIDKYEEINVGGWMVASSVSEFIGRLGAIHTSVEFGGELPEKEVEVPDTQGTELTGEELYNYIKEKDVTSISNFETWMTANHATGYRTAENNILEAEDDPRLIYKDPKKIWNDYNMEEEMINSIEKAWGIE